MVSQTEITLPEVKDSAPNFLHSCQASVGLVVADAAGQPTYTLVFSSQMQGICHLQMPLPVEVCTDETGKHGRSSATA